MPSTSSHSTVSERTPLTHTPPEERECASEYVSECVSEAVAAMTPNRYALTLVFMCVFVGDMARGVLFPTLWLFVQQMGVSVCVCECEFVCACECECECE